MKYTQFVKQFRDDNKDLNMTFADCMKSEEVKKAFKDFCGCPKIDQKDGNINIILNFGEKDEEEPVDELGSKNDIRQGIKRPGTVMPQREFKPPPPVIDLTGDDDDDYGTPFPRRKIKKETNDAQTDAPEWLQRQEAPQQQPQGAPPQQQQRSIGINETKIDSDEEFYDPYEDEPEAEPGFLDYTGQMYPSGPGAATGDESYLQPTKVVDDEDDSTFGRIRSAASDAIGQVGPQGPGLGEDDQWITGDDNWYSDLFAAAGAEGKSRAVQEAFVDIMENKPVEPMEPLTQRESEELKEALDVIDDDDWDTGKFWEEEMARIDKIPSALRSLTYAQIFAYFSGAWAAYEGYYGAADEVVSRVLRMAGYKGDNIKDILSDPQQAYSLLDYAFKFRGYIGGVSDYLIEDASYRILKNYGYDDEQAKNIAKQVGKAAGYTEVAATYGSTVGKKAKEFVDNYLPKEFVQGLGSAIGTTLVTGVTYLGKYTLQNSANVADGVRAGAGQFGEALTNAASTLANDPAVQSVAAAVLAAEAGRQILKNTEISDITKPFGDVFSRLNDADRYNRRIGPDDTFTDPSERSFYEDYRSRQQGADRSRQQGAGVINCCPAIRGGKLKASDLRKLLESSYSGAPVDNWKMERSMSTANSKVYRNPSTGQVVVAHKGTQGAQDWGNNLIYAVTGEMGYRQTKRFKEAQKVQKAAENAFGRDMVSTVGHSQGGLQAQMLGKDSKEIITMNKATRPQEMLFGSSKKKNQTDIRTSSDPVSAFSSPFASKKKKVTIDADTADPLKSHSYANLDKLGDQMIGEGIRQSALAKFESDWKNKLWDGKFNVPGEWDDKNKTWVNVKAYRAALARMEPERKKAYKLLKDRLDRDRDAEAKIAIKQKKAQKGRF